MQSSIRRLIFGLGMTVAIGLSNGARAEELKFHDGVLPASGTETKAYPASTKTSFKMGLSNISVVNTYRVQMIEEAKYEASQHKEISNFVVTDAGGSTNKQIADIEDLVAQKVDVLIVAPGSESALNGVLDKAYDAGIPVIIFNADAGPKNFTSKILADERYFGEVGAKYLAEAMGGKGQVIGLRGIAGNSIDNDRWNAAMDVFKQYPDIKVVDSAFGEWAYDKGKQICETLLIAHPDVAGIWSSGGAMTQACAEVMEENGMSFVPMTGESNNGFLRTWQQKKLQAIAPISATWTGAAAVVAGLKVLKGEPIAKQYVLRPDPITEKDAAKFYAPDFKDSYWVGSALPHDKLVELYGK